MKNVLFVGHDDRLFGGPLALLRLLRIIKGNEKINTDVLIISKHGVLFDQYAEVADHVFSGLSNKNLLEKIASRLSLLTADYEKIVKKVGLYDLVIFNTVVALNYFKKEDLLLFKKKALLIYEMPIARELYIGKDRDKIGMMDLIFSPSPALTKGLLESQIPKDKIHELNQYLEIEEAKSEHSNARTDANSILHIGMMGLPQWTKGFELFLLLAKRYSQRFPDSTAHFVWKGIYPGQAMYPVYSEDVRKAGMQDIVRFEGHTDKVESFYKSIDVLALTSREDTFPYVMMEAAVWNKPTICFEESGGAVDFVMSYNGFVVPFLDIEKFVEAIHAYYMDRELLQKHGAAAKEFILKNHCDDEMIRNQFYNGLNSVFAKSQKTAELAI